MSLYASRRRSNFTAMTLCLIATGIGIIWLFLILFSLILNGLPHLSFSTFVEMTPPPGETGGGLANSIFGTLLMTFLGVGVGAPIGVMAGTYLAEYGRYSKATPAIRFINDILLGTLDHHWSFHLRTCCFANEEFFRTRRRLGFGCDRHSHCCENNRRHVVACAEHFA